MHLTVALPGLLWPDLGDIDYLYAQIQTTNLDRLIKHASISHLNYSYSDLLYMNQISLNKPAVSLSHKMDPGLRRDDMSGAHNSLATSIAQDLGVIDGSKTFLIAEPTHLRADRDRLLISEAELLQLDTTEAQAIIAAINQHFNAEINLYYVTEHLWLIGLNLTKAHNKFFPIVDIIGENIDPYLPKQEQAIQYSRLLNEIQMLLFTLKSNL